MKLSSYEEYVERLNDSLCCQEFLCTDCGGSHESHLMKNEFTCIGCYEARGWDVDEEAY